MKEPAFKNIILISMDATSPERLSCYGHSRKTTPRIEKVLSEGGIIFEKAFSQAPYTVMSHSSMLTSLYLLSHKVTGWTSRLNAELTLASVLKKGGFVTAGFTSHPCLSRKFGYDTGFDTFARDWRIQRLSIKNDLILLFKSLKEILIRGIKIISRLPVNRGKLELSCEYALKWIKTNRKKRFFLFLHLFSAHPYYSAPQPFGGLFLKDIPEKFEGIRKRERQWGYVKKLHEYPENEKNELVGLLEALHDEEIAYNDHQLGSLIDTLKKLNLYNDTLVVVTSDHGNFLPKRLKRKERAVLFDENTHVPLIFINPSLKPNQRSDCLAQVIDIFPTLLSFAGVEVPPIAQGKDLKSTILNQAPGPHQFIYSNYAARNKISSSVRSAEWKFIYDENTHQAQLYNLSQDPKELDNLSDKIPEKKDSFLKEYSGWKKRILEYELPVQKKPLSRDETEQLRALGYID